MRRPVVTVLFLAGAVRVAGAADITVTRLDDPAGTICQPADCSLRAAVNLANGLPGADTIHLPAGMLQLTIPHSTSDATTGDLDLSDAIEIVGVDATSTSVIAVNNDRIFYVNAGISLTLRKLTLGGGHAADFGGAIANFGKLLIEDAVLGNNTAGSIGGGAIFSESNDEIVLRRVQFINNTASNNGGAISAGAYPALAAGALIVDSKFSGNQAALNGGAYYGSTARVYRSLFQNNQVGSSSGFGGALMTAMPSEIHQSTLAGNSAGYGGGVYAYGPLTVELSTFSGNSASAAGGALLMNNDNVPNGSGFSIGSSTLYLNTAPSGSAVYFLNQAGTGNPPDFESTLVSGTCERSDNVYSFSGARNVESPGNTCNFDNGQGNYFNVPDANLHLAALADNGGPTPTHLPQAGSALIDASGPICWDAFDQRGYVRVDGACDTGAVEVGALDDVIFREGFDF